MPRRCSVPGCRSNQRDKLSVGIKYVSCYAFPSDPNLRKKWLVAIGQRDFVPNYYNAVCAKHFAESSFELEETYKDSNGELKIFKFAKPKLKNGAVPSTRLGRDMSSESRRSKNVNVTVPLSTFIDGLQLGGKSMMKERVLNDVDDGTTCMDFVEVEIKEFESDDGAFECGSLDLRVRKGNSNKCDAEEFGDCVVQKCAGKNVDFDECTTKNGHRKVGKLGGTQGFGVKGGIRCKDDFGDFGGVKIDESNSLGMRNCGEVVDRCGDSVVTLENQWSGCKFGVVAVDRQSRGQNPVIEKGQGEGEGEEWGGGWVVKEELFKGLGLVPRRVFTDVPAAVDRRHCVRGRRPSEGASPSSASASSSRRRGPLPLASSPKSTVFYPAGSVMFDTEKFIGEIQKRPAIYDVRSKVYSNRVAKLKYWHEVGKEMYKGWEALDQMERRTLVKELQIKWKSIRDHFMRQLKQNMNGEGPKKKKYVHFDQLQFLTANLGVKRPRHSYKPPKLEPEEEYMEFTPELPEERHFSFVTSVDGPEGVDEHEVPVASMLPQPQPEDLSYHHRDLSYHPKELSYHKELQGDRMGNKMFLLSLLPIMERLPDHANIRARLQLMEVLQTFVAHEDSSHRDFYSYHDEKPTTRSDTSLQHSTVSHSDSDT